MAGTGLDDDRPVPVLRVLGPLELGRSAAAAEPVPGRLGRLLAALTLRAGTVVSADRLADTIWTDDDLPDNPEGALQNLVSRLRPRLRRAAVPFDVLHRPPGYLLDLDVRMVDATHFDTLVTAARQELVVRPDRAAATLDEALALWRGPAYAEFADEDFARPEAARLEELRLAAEESRAEAALNLGQHHDVTARLEGLVAAEPLRERPHRLLVLAHFRSGRQADALAVARTYRWRLREELGLDPSPTLDALEADVLRQDPALAWSGRADTTADARHPGGHPATVAARQSPSPAAPGGLLGREDDLGVLRDLVSPGALVTLTGPGGVGKTTLALRVAVDVGARFGDGAAVAELAAVSTAGEVAPAVLTALDVQPRQGVGHLDRLVEYLRSREVLLVLDNCEHVVEAAAELAHEVHRRCPRVSVLATSRFPLEVHDERLWAVTPLALPPATSTVAAELATAPSVRLFVERASARNRSFALDDSNASDVAEVCRRLDGLPLAIELAAARIGSLSPADLVQRMSWRFHLLHGGPRTGAERHRTLRAVVDWSYALLGPVDRRVFEALSVFAGSFTLETAEKLLEALPHVATAPHGPVPVGEAAGAVLDLVDRSMVVVAAREPATRYSVLETLRAYGRERLEERGDSEKVQRAHAELFARVAEEASTHMLRAGHVAAVERVGAAFDELRAAVAWAVEHDVDLAARLVGALAIYVEHRIPAEVPEWAERTLSAAARTERPVPGLARVHGVAAACARFAGDLAGAEAQVRAGMAVAQDADTKAYLRYLLGEVSIFQGRLADVQQVVDDAAAEQPPRPVTRLTAVLEPLLLVHRGDLRGAQSRAREILRAVERVGEEVTTAWAAYVYGETLIDTDPPLATALITDALATGRRLGERYLTGVALTSAASVRGRHGDARDAAPLFRDVLEHWRQVGDWTHQWTALRNVAELLVRMHRDREAAVLHGALVGRTDTVPLFGADAVRMAEARAVLQQRLGSDTFNTLCETGRRLSDDEVVATAAGYLA